MKTTYDKDADAVYIYFRKNKEVAKTIKLKDRLLVDVDDEGNVLGLELLDASNQLTKNDLQNLSVTAVSAA